MKKLITLLFVLCLFSTLSAQQEVTIGQGDSIIIRIHQVTEIINPDSSFSPVLSTDIIQYSIKALMQNGTTDAILAKEELVFDTNGINQKVINSNLNNMLGTHTLEVWATRFVANNQNIRSFDSGIVSVIVNVIETDDNRPPKTPVVDIIIP